MQSKQQQSKWSRPINWRTQVTCVDVDTGEEIVFNNNYIELKIKDKINDYEQRVIRITKYCKRKYRCDLFGIEK